MKSILLVEDEPTHVLLVKHLLRHYSCTLTVVDDGAEALRELESNLYDLVMMDIRLPFMSGEEATKRIRSSSTRYKDVPIVAVTAFALEEDRRKFEAAGVDDFVAKPIEEANLFRALNRFLTA